MGNGGVLLDMTRYNSVRRYMASAFKTGLKRSAVLVRGIPNVHEMRDSFRTRASECRVSADVAEFLLGHSIDELNYNKIFYDERYVWSELKKMFMSTNAKVSALREEVEMQRRKIQELERRLEAFESFRITGADLGTAEDDE